MLGRHHLLLSLFTVALLLVPYLDHIEIVLLILIGVGIGSLIPDADSPDATIFHTRVKRVKGNLGELINNTIALTFPFFGYVTKYLIYKPMIFIF